jgi:hypothetical protein
MKRLLIQLVLPLVLLVTSFSAHAVGCTGTGNCYWVGGTGSVSDTTKWATASGGAVTGGLPSATDNCIFNSASSGASYTVTVGTALTCKDLTMAQPATGSLTLAGSSTINIVGSETLAAGMTSSYSGTKTYSSTTSGKTITTNGVSMTNAATFNGVGGVWTLAGAFTTSGTITLTNGTFNDGGFNVTAGIFSSSNSNVRRDRKIVV